LHADRAEFLFDGVIANAFCNLVEGVDQHLCVAQFGERASNVTDESVLASVAPFADLLPKQSQTRSSAFQAFASVMNRLIGRNSVIA
jgi:hypothetical protein